MAEKHYTEFDCDYCKSYPCKRFEDKALDKVIRYNCKDFKEDIILNLESKLNEIKINKYQACKDQKYEAAIMLRDQEKKILLDIENEKNKMIG